MASKYLQMFPIQKDFPYILNDLIKEILRDQPEDIEIYCLQYFDAQQNNSNINIPKTGIYDKYVTKNNNFDNQNNLEDQFIHDQAQIYTSKLVNSKVSQMMEDDQQIDKKINPTVSTNGSYQFDEQKMIEKKKQIEQKMNQRYEGMTPEQLQEIYQQEEQAATLKIQNKFKSKKAKVSTEIQKDQENSSQHKLIIQN